MLTEKYDESEPLAQDDGWWASVLAEEKDHRERAKKVSNKPVEAKRTSLQDWEKAKSIYKQDAIVTLRVIGHNRGGVLVEGEGLSGFVPYSHLTGVNNTSNLVEREKILAKYMDQSLGLKVIECVPDDGRIIFSERAAETGAGQRTALFANLQPGQRISGTITNTTDFGVFLDLGGVEGLIHISELSWGRVNHPSEIVKGRKSLEVQVLEVSPERCRVALSLKRLSENPWQNAENDYVVGKIVAAKITSVVSFGAFARLEDGCEGLIHASEIPLENGGQIADLLEEGQTVQVRILHIDAHKQRMGLSLNTNL